MPLGKREGRPWRGRNPVTPAVRTIEFRSIFDINRLSTGANFTQMGLSHMETYQNPAGANSQLVNAINGLDSGVKSWTWMGGFTPSAGGGSFGVSDSKLDSVMTSTAGGFNVANQAKNGHRYALLDDQQCDFSGLTSGQRDANLATIAARVALIKTYDPDAICSVMDYRQVNIQTNNVWTTANVDEIWLDGYPNTATYDSDRIPDQMEWAESVSIPYVGVIQCHDYVSGGYEYPTTGEMTTMFNQWLAGNPVGLVIYAWNDGEGSTHLDADDTMQGHIGSLMATITP